MKHSLLIKIMLNDGNDGYIKALRCYKDTVQLLEEMQFSQGTIIISKSKTSTSIDITQGSSSEAWIIENK